MRGRAVVVLLTLVSFAPAGFTLGRPQGTVGLDGRVAWGRFWQKSTDHLPLDPVLRAGVEVLPDIAAGAEIGLLWTLPQHQSPLSQTPMFCFGPTVAWYCPLTGRLRLARQRPEALQPYALAGLAFVYHSEQIQGWQVKLAIGGEVAPGRLPIGAGVETGWFASRLVVDSGSEPEVLTGNAVFFGLRLTGRGR